MAHTRMYCKGVLEVEDFPVADISEHLERPDTIVWADFCAPSKEELHELADELGLHPLAVEDALDEHQRPKLDHYASHLFLSCHAVRLDPDSGLLQETEIDAFIGERWLVTVRKDEGFAMEPVVARWDRSRGPRRVRRQLPALRRARRRRGRLLRHGPAVRRVLRPGQREDLLRAADGGVAATALVPGPPVPHPVPPPRGPDAGGGERAHAPRALRRRRQPVSLLPGRLRPHPAGQRVDRCPARPDQHDRRHQPELARLPLEPDHEEGDQLGRHHRRADPDHRVVRHERALSGQRRARRAWWWRPSS